MSSTDPVSSPPEDSALAARDPAKRRRALLIVAAVFIVAGLAWYIAWAFVFSVRVVTDNAYVGGDQVAISAQVPGTVVAILADDTQYVEAGQVLVRLDATDADTRLAQARSALAQAVRGVRQQAAVAGSADAQVTAATIALGKARADLTRRLPLVDAQAESPETMQHLRDGVAQAEAALAVARAQAVAAHAAIDGTGVDDNPVVAEARAAFRAAWVAARRNTIIAPVDGYIAERSVQLGNSVAPGQRLMTVVPLGHLWVDANFKESQLGHVRVGQQAKVVSDLHGPGVVYHGTVVGLGAGTGSVFSLLPAQNATGNWIKVVQRVPVRIALDPRELAEQPLRVGLSTEVTIDIRGARGNADGSGSALTGAGASPAGVETSVYDQVAADAEAEAGRVIRANLGADPRG